MVGCGLARPGGRGAGVSGGVGVRFRGLGWGWDRRCQEPGGGGPGDPIPWLCRFGAPTTSGK